uniref:Uncharacterized protein n=1 Tax=Salix viminalis TaxID=40686 RepID=A0A6N2K8M6_SALVM
MLFSQRQVPLNTPFMEARNYVQEDQVTTLNLIQRLFIFTMPVLLNFLELMYPGKNYSPFDRHTFTMWVVLACWIIAWSMGSYFQSPVYASAVRSTAELFCSLSVASLASIIFSRMYSAIVICSMHLTSNGVYVHPSWHLQEHGFRID